MIYDTHFSCPSWLVRALFEEKPALHVLVVKMINILPPNKSQHDSGVYKSSVKPPLYWLLRNTASLGLQVPLHGRKSRTGQMTVRVLTTNGFKMNERITWEMQNPFMSFTLHYFIFLWAYFTFSCSKERDPTFQFSNCGGFSRGN